MGVAQYSSAAMVGGQWTGSATPSTIRPWSIRAPPSSSRWQPLACSTSNTTAPPDCSHRPCERHTAMVTALLHAARAEKVRRSLTLSAGWSALLAGWLAFDRGDTPAPTRLLRRCHRRRPRHRRRRAVHRRPRSASPTQLHDAATPSPAWQLAHTAATRTPGDPRATAWATSRVAVYAARLGERKTAESAMHRSLELGHHLPNPRPGDDSQSWTRSFDQARLLSSTAHAAALLDDPNALDYAAQAVAAAQPRQGQITRRRTRRSRTHHRDHRRRPFLPRLRQRGNRTHPRTGREPRRRPPPRDHPHRYATLQHAPHPRTTTATHPTDPQRSNLGTSGPPHDRANRPSRRAIATSRPRRPQRFAVPTTHGAPSLVLMGRRRVSTLRRSRVRLLRALLQSVAQYSARRRTAVARMAPA